MPIDLFPRPPPPPPPSPPPPPPLNTQDYTSYHSTSSLQPTNMKTRRLMSPLVIIAILTLATPIFAEVVVWQPCSRSDQNLPTNCTVHEVRVKPCKEALSKKPCRIKRGQEASISFDFTPNFTSDNLQSSAYWANDMQDIGFPGMNMNACGNTACPTTSGTRQTYSYELAISKSFPVRIFNVKWKLWNEEAQECCILFQIKLTK